MDDFASSSWTTRECDGLDQFITKWGSESLPPMVANQVGDSSRGDGNTGDIGGNDKTSSASKNHSEAEKRRRERINAHLATLKKLISTSDKMDKATLLGKVVEHLKELKSATTELSKLLGVPTDSDDVIIDLVDNTLEPGNHIFIKTSICCEDRPELLLEINRALKSLRLTMVQADIACLGGRIKCDFILCVVNNTSATEIATLKQALRMTFGRIVASSSWTSSSSYRIKSKRQRFFCSSSYNTKGCH